MNAEHHALLCLAYVCGVVLGRQNAPERRRIVPRRSMLASLSTYAYGTRWRVLAIRTAS
jgi:uncharacterized membrane protein YbjE (DUF340 family)